MPDLTNQQILDACTVQIKRDTATIERLRKDAARAARSAEINLRVAKAASAARDASPITITGRESRGPFALGVATGMAQRRLLTEFHEDRILTKAAGAKAAPAMPPGHQLKAHLEGVIGGLKAAGLSSDHPAVYALQEAANRYGNDVSDPEDDGPAAEVTAAAIQKAASLLPEGAEGVLRAVMTARGVDPDAGTRFGRYTPGSGATGRQVQGGFEQGGAG